MRLHHRRSAGQFGQTVPLTALFMVVLIWFTAIVVDGGGYLLTRRNLQGNADAAALAGARDLPGNPGVAELAAEDYAENRNDSDVADVEDITLAESNTQITVDVERVTTSCGYAAQMTSLPHRATPSIARASGCGNGRIRAS